MSVRNHHFPKAIRSHRFPVLPPFMDGQLPSSLVHNILQFNRKTSVPLAYKHLLGYDKGLDGMQSGLMDLFQQVGCHYYDEVATLIHRHTEYYFYCCGLPLEKHQRQFDRLKGKLSGPIRLARLPALCTFSEGSYMRCPDCEEDQLNDAECGFTYDHRRMGSPFLMVCPIHGTKIRSSSGQMLLFDKECQSSMTAAQARYSQEIGARAAYCMEVPPEVSGYHKDAVIEALKRAGRIGENGRLRLSETIADLQRFTKGKFADLRLDHLVQTPYYIENALRALLRLDHAVHPMWCVIFVWFADECARVTPPIQTKNTRSRRPTVTPSQEELEKKIRQHGSLTGAAAALDINLNRVISLCNRYDIKYTKRTKRIDSAIEAAMQGEYDNGADPAEVARRCGVSLATAYRCLQGRADGLSPNRRKKNARTERAKNDWTRLLNTYEKKTNTELRRIAPGTWVQLKRKAPEWLQSNSPNWLSARKRKKSAPPQLFLERLEYATSRVQQLCASPNTRPIRQSKYHFQKYLGVSEYVVRDIFARIKLGHAAEIHGDFVKRRVEWASARISVAEVKIWKLARLAGIRQSSYENHLKNVSAIDAGEKDMHE